MAAANVGAEALGGTIRGASAAGGAAAGAAFGRGVLRLPGSCSWPTSLASQCLKRSVLPEARQAALAKSLAASLPWPRPRLINET